MITGGNIADCTAGATLLDRLPDCEVAHADKGYDANALRQKSRNTALWPTSRPRRTGNGKTASRHSSIATATPSSARSAASSNFRRIATRYDRNAVNFLAAVCVAATIRYWL